MPAAKALALSLSLSALWLVGCAPTAKAPPQTQDVTIHFDGQQLEQIIAKSKSTLEESNKDSKELAIWKDNPSYAGGWTDNDGSEHYGYSEFCKPLGIQDFDKLRLTIMAQYHPTKFTLEKAKYSLPVGDTILFQQVLNEATTHHLIPGTNGIGYNLGKTHFLILIKKKADIPDILKATDYLHIPREIIDFQEITLVPI